LLLFCSLRLRNFFFELNRLLVWFCSLPVSFYSLFGFKLFLGRTRGVFSILVNLFNLRLVGFLRLFWITWSLLRNLNVFVDLGLWIPSFLKPRAGVKKFDITLEFIVFLGLFLRRLLALFELYPLRSLIHLLHFHLHNKTLNLQHQEYFPRFHATNLRSSLPVNSMMARNL
jgi:hypothetical protein